MPLSIEDHKDRVAGFVVRLRRVLASPLAQDDEQLARAHTMNFQQTTDGRALVSDWLPEEPALESLASRLRPLLLRGDPVHYATGLASVGALLRGNGRPDAMAQTNVRAQKKAWAGLTNQARGRYVIFDLGPVDQTDDERKPQQWRDREAAEGWFYSDLIHADTDRQAHLGNLNLEERVHAAFGLVADVVDLSWKTLGLVWVHRRQLALPSWAWDKPVGVEPGWRTREGDVYIGEEGTLLPPIEMADLSQDWEKFAPGNPIFEEAHRAFKDDAGPSPSQLLLETHQQESTDSCGG